MKDKLFGKGSVLVELLIGILVFGILVQIAGFIFFDEKLFYAVGLWIGVATAVFMACHMAYSIEQIVNVEEKRAPGKLRMYVILRYLTAVLVVMAVFFLKIGNPLTCIAGIMGLKVGAYMQPLTHKMLRR